MTALPVISPKPITAKLLNSQLQAWEMMQSQYAMCQPIRGLGSNALPACNAFNTPHKRACRSSEQQDDRDFSVSLA